MNNIIDLSGFGKYLRANKQTQEFILFENRKETEKFSFFEVKQIFLSSGNSIHTDVLFIAQGLGIDVFILSPAGKVYGFLSPLAVWNYPNTRLKQAEVFNNGKGLNIAKELIRAKIEQQKLLAHAHGFALPRTAEVMKKLNQAKTPKEILAVEGKASSDYFQGIQALFPSFFNFKKRTGRGANDIGNNVLNQVYGYLSALCLRSLLLAHLDPAVGFLHTHKDTHLSLISDFIEPFRPLADEYTISFCQGLNKKDFVLSKDYRVFLNNRETGSLFNGFNEFLTTKVEITGHKSIIRRSDATKARIDAIIRDEAYSMARFIRGEIKDYNIREIRIYQNE